MKKVTLAAGIAVIALVTPSSASDQYPSDIHAMLNCLKSEEAEVVSLRVIAGLDVPSVAAITGKSESNIRVITHCSLNKLNEQLTKEGWATGYQGGAI